MAKNIELEKHILENINVLDLIGIAIVLIIAFAFQFHGKEMPCPLCLLQRFGFLMMAFGLLMNLTFGLKPSNYALSALAAMFTALTSMRQMFLHIVPGTGSYGGTLFGWHLYTWCFVFSGLFLVATFIGLLFNAQFSKITVKRSDTHDYIAVLLAALFIILLLVNVIGAYMECGVHFLS